MEYFGPVSANHSTPWAALSRSTIAFLTIFWQAGTLESCDLIDGPLTGNSASAGAIFPGQRPGAIEELAEIAGLEAVQP